jgi:toxin ParE1/3/4
VRRIRILEDALDEAVAAATWYDQEKPGLGIEFEQALDAVLDLLEEDLVPLVPVPGESAAMGAKQFLLRRFPYSIVVRESDDEYLVIAIAHQHRRPGYWKGR